MTLLEKKNIFPKDISQVAVEVWELILKQSHHKNILFLNGDMAAGKTTFVRSLVESLGGRGIQSPTFALHHRYPLEKFDIEHLDLYRMDSELELDGLGFWDFFDSPENLILIEWPQKMTLAHLPKSWNIYELTIQSSDSGTSRNYSLKKIPQMLGP